MSRRIACALIGGLLLSGTASARRDDSKLDALLVRLDGYFRSYEAELPSITADERYEQKQTLPGYRRSGAAGQLFRLRTRILYSEMAFVRLPGDGEWAGYRDVRKVDGKSVAEGGMRLAALLTKGSDVVSQAAAITTASSRYNLGAARTVNMPTVSLEVLHPRYRQQFIYKLAGSEVVRGVETVRIDFAETGSPTVIRGPAGGDVPSDGSAWIDPETGRLWRAQVMWKGGSRNQAPTNRDPRISVDFGMDRRLKLMVPVEMREVFFVEDGIGEAHATYSNFKRFETGARLVP